MSAKRWAAFLDNHREVIAAMDFFTVPTLTFGILHWFFVIAHDRRRIIHCNVTRHPSSAWISQQLREAFPYDSTPSYLIFDRAANFNEEVIRTVKSFGIQPKRSSFRSPWQNGIAERWVGNCRRDLLNYVIVLNERHLNRLISEYIRYYHDDRTHLALEKGTPAGRTAAKGLGAGSRVTAMPRLGGLASSLRFGRLSFDQATTTLRINRQGTCACRQAAGRSTLVLSLPMMEKYFEPSRRTFAQLP